MRTHCSFGDKICIARGSLDTIKNELLRILEEDYRSHFYDGVMPYRVEYIATREGLKKSSLLVLTRLYSDSKPGNIYYGTIISHDSSDEYSVWVDPVEDDE